MTFALLDPKVWLVALALAVASYGLGRWQGDDAGYSRCKNAVSAAAHRQYVQDEKRGYDASANFQKEQDHAQSQSQARREIVTKIVDRPVYRNVCIDPDGVQQLNAEIARSPTSR